MDAANLYPFFCTINEWSFYKVRRFLYFIQFFISNLSLKQPKIHNPCPQKLKGTNVL